LQRCIFSQQTGWQQAMAFNSLRSSEEINVENDNEVLGKLTVLKFVRLEHFLVFGSGLPKDRHLGSCLLTLAVKEEA